MKATVSLKQLRTDPRHFVALLNSGHKVSITEHRKVLSTASSVNSVNVNNVANLLNVLKSINKITVTDLQLDTLNAYNKSKTTALKNKYNK